jgi:threonine aldolase
VPLNDTPAQMSWQSGTDVLSCGATEGRVLAAEAAVVFDLARAAFFGEGRKRAGHLVSTRRFTVAQMAAHLADDCRLPLARRANAMADQLAQRLKSVGLAPV